MLKLSYANSPEFEEKRKQRSLDNKRIVQREGLCISSFSRLFNAISIKTGEIFDINCRSWRCPKHKEKWARKWGLTIKEQLELTPATLLVNLTTAEYTGNEAIFLALQFFMRRFRDFYGPTQYVKVVDYNKKHTQPHFHLILVCEELEIPEMPKGWDKKLSWPEDVHEVINDFWTEALNYAAPENKETIITWNQPPQSGPAAANYAVNYITGKNKKKKDKNEEPDYSWRGRRLTYSKNFFHMPAAIIWKEILTRLFGPPDPEDKFFWRLKPLEEQRPDLGDNGAAFSTCEIMKHRDFLAAYYRSFGEFPPEKIDKYCYSNVVFEMGETGQEYFIPELLE